MIPTAGIETVDQIIAKSVVDGVALSMSDFPDASVFSP